MVAFPLAVVSGLVLVALAPTGAGRAAGAIYAVTSSMLFGVSAVYHRGHWSRHAHQVLKRLDHANIYLMIAGSYTPVAVLALHGAARVTVLAVVWAGALAGVLFRLVWVNAPRWLYTPLYVVLGWIAAFFVPQLLHGAGVAPFALIVTGGGLYTIGGLVYGLRWPDPSPRWFGFHEIFHSFTIAAYTVQYIAVSLITYEAIRVALTG